MHVEKSIPSLYSEDFLRQRQLSLEMAKAVGRQCQNGCPVHSNTDSMLVLSIQQVNNWIWKRKLNGLTQVLRHLLLQLCTLCSRITVKFFCKPIWKNTIRAIVHQLSIIATGGNTNKFLKEVKFNLLLCWKLLSSLIFYSLCCICYESEYFLALRPFLDGW